MQSPQMVFEKRPDDFSPLAEVAGTYLLCNDKILFLEVGPHKKERGRWGVPGGKISPGETPLQGALRELFEETGIDTVEERDLTSYGELYVRYPEADFIYHVFGTKVETPPPIHLSQEHSAYKWVSRAESETLFLMRGGKEALDLFFHRSTKKERTGASINVYLLLFRKDELLLHLRKNSGYFDNCYGLISGHVEDGESAQSAMVREAYEEAGIYLEAASLKAVHVMHRRSDRRNVDLFFECSDWRGEVTNREPEKCGGLSFFPITGLPDNTIDYVKKAVFAALQGDFYSEKGWENL